MRGTGGLVLAAPLVYLLLCACTTAAPASSGAAGTAIPSRSAIASTAQAPQSAANRTPAAGAAAGTATHPAAPATVPGSILLQASGDNPPGTNCCTVNLRTGAFDSPGSWDLNWIYDCSRFGRTGNLGIDVYRTDGSFISIPPSINQVGSGGQGAQAYTQAGGFSVTVNSVCRWSLTVTTSARPTSTPGPAAQAGPAVLQPEPALINAIPTPPTGAGIAAPAAGAAVAPATAVSAAPAPAGAAAPAAVPTLQPSAPAPAGAAPAATAAAAGGSPTATP